MDRPAGQGHWRSGRGEGTDHGGAEGSLFTKRSDISEADFFDAARQEKAQAAAAAINDCVAEISQLYTEENRYRSARDGLVPWETMSEPLDLDSTEHVEITLGTLPGAASLETIRGELAEQAPESELVAIHSSKELHYVVLLALKETAAAASSVLKPYSFSVVKFKGMEGNAAQNIAQLDEKLAEVNAKREEAIQQIKALGDQRSELKLAIDRFYANSTALRTPKKAVLLLTMEDDTMESAAGAVLSFQGMTNYLGWERVGVISALSCGDLAAMERTDYPQQAYELGKNLR